jgi:hypothetical protein
MEKGGGGWEKSERGLNGREFQRILLVSNGKFGRHFLRFNMTYYEL